MSGTGQRVLVAIGLARVVVLSVSFQANVRQRSRSNQRCWPLGTVTSRICTLRGAPGYVPVVGVTVTLCALGPAAPTPSSAGRLASSSQRQAGFRDSGTAAFARDSPTPVLHVAVWATSRPAIQPLQLPQRAQSQVNQGALIEGTSKHASLLVHRRLHRCCQVIDSSRCPAASTTSRG